MHPPSLTFRTDFIPLLCLLVAKQVGLRRESAVDARIRYDTLIKRIFVKSLIGPIMLATTTGKKNPVLFCLVVIVPDDNQMLPLAIMTASYDESNLMDVLNDILHDDGMLDSRANPGNNTPVDACRAYCSFLLTNRTFLCHYITAVPLITAVSSKMSASPSQLCLLRNYNYGGGELPDSFTIDPNKARQRLGLEIDGELEILVAPELQKTVAPIKCAPRTGKGSRYPGKYTTVSCQVETV